ncbi:hypothetical protein OV208_08210 [Corallococcus sp. bb12-1]|uniref:hypothetical protein n=1 Tax=Corallococcus sp. bb12-1 TaxID=2996784 RepID=UPI00226F3D8D|nr:hypothetical protein [Corallococcus sp. bb12-1]MCY1041299.1 hypothetical protein [Corallococcus sp. bb12-1]
MIRSDKRRGPTLAVLALACAAVWGTGCKKEEAVAPAVVVDAGVVAAAAVPDAGAEGVVAKVSRPLRFSDVKLAHDGERVSVTYTLTNPGTVQGRGDACLWLHDDRGAVIEALRLGAISVKGGTFDTFEDRALVTAAFWKQTRSVRLFTTNKYCQQRSPEASSELAHLLPTGRPVPEVFPRPRDLETSQPADFEVSNVRLRHDVAAGDYLITYTVKNLGGRRASGMACLRAYADDGCSCHLEESSVGDFSLPPGGSETVTDTILFNKDQHWNQVKVLRLALSESGCADDVDEVNPGFKFDKPEGIQGPAEAVDADGEVELDPDNNDAVVDVPDEPQDPVDDHGGDEPYSDSPEDTGH